MTFPAPVPEIPHVDKAAPNCVNTLGFTIDWGGDQGGIAGISRVKFRLYHQSLRPRVLRQHRPYPYSGSISTARLTWTIFSHSGRLRRRRSFPSPRTNRGSCASLLPSILMATSFVSSMISGATYKGTTHRAKRLPFYKPFIAHSSRASWTPCGQARVRIPANPEVHDGRSMLLRIGVS
jgi:hypothetical protein